jgi:hypothetical protein
MTTTAHAGTINIPAPRDLWLRSGGFQRELWAA